jgi:uncharacterized membrane protein
MSTRLRLEARRVADRAGHGDPYWPAQAAVAAAILLNLTLPATVTLGPRWPVGAVEGVLLAALVWITPARATEHVRGARRVALVVVGVVTIANAASLALLIHSLINGGKVGGHALILSGAVLWLTSVLLFAVFYWEMDRGGAVNRFRDPDALADFQFPQMENPQLAPPGWRPGFIDYLYVSLTNATAFSPTDTMPLTHTAKAVMGVQSVTAFLTLGLVVARAVNILG